LIKSCSGIVAALAVLCCCSQAEGAQGGANLQTREAYRDAAAGAQGPEWVLYEDMPEDGEIVSFNQAGDGDGAFEICQSEDGAVGSTEETQGGLVCRTASGAEESFYVLRMPLAEGDAHDVPRRGLAAKFHEKHGTGQPEMGELPPFMQFEFTDEEKIEIGEAMAETDAMKRMREECAGADRPDTCGPKPKQGFLRDGLVAFWFAIGTPQDWIFDQESEFGDGFDGPRDANERNGGEGR
jgi:hypothetical protein